MQRQKQITAHLSFCSICELFVEQPVAVPAVYFFCAASSQSSSGGDASDDEPVRDNEYRQLPSSHASSSSTEGLKVV